MGIILRAGKAIFAEIPPKASRVAKVTNQPALAPGDIPHWWRDLEGRGGMAARALQFLTLKAARSGEVRGMTWEEVDLGAPDKTGHADRTRPATWIIPASRMKGGREHRVPLTEEAVALLRALLGLHDSHYVFFAARGGMLSDMSISAVMRRMQEARVKAGDTGYLGPRSKRPAVPHGPRSTFRQWAAEHGYPRDMAEIALAHFIGTEVERAYQRSDMLKRRRAMMAAWVDHLNEATGGDNVVQLVGP